jgi:hypothetical protein
MMMVRTDAAEAGILDRHGDQAGRIRLGSGRRIFGNEVSCSPGIKSLELLLAS